MLLCLVLALTTVTPQLNAPADENFGRLHYSAIRIRMNILQEKAWLQYHKRAPDDITHYLEFTAESYYAWGTRYPHDEWLASTGYALAQLFASLPGVQARNDAVRAYRYVGSHFAQTPYGKNSAAALRRGLPLRPEPAWAAIFHTPGPSPSPSGSPSALPSPTPSASPH